MALSNPMMSCSLIHTEDALAEVPVCELRLNMYFYLVFILLSYILLHFYGPESTNKDLN